MRPLNRPMFRMGGPIKEGVMSGIREPKKNGGSMLANDEGPKRAALVGNPIYPKGPDGRTNHVLPFIIGQGLRMAARPFGQFVMKRAIPYASRVKYRPSSMSSGPGGFERGKTLFKRGEVFEPNKFGKAFINDPLAKTVMGGTSMVGRGIKAGGKGIYNVGKYATTTPSGLAFLGLPVTYQAGKYFLSSGEEIKDPNDIKKIKQVGPPGGGETRLGSKEAVYDAPKKGSGVELTDKQLRQRKIDRYRDIMDIKGMNKDAAYNSLIEASRLINESGDFKGDLKSGRLINQIIQGASKAFDKPKATKDAIDTLILKGEIEKDIKASDPTAKQKALLTEKQIEIANKTLAGDSFTDIITERYKKGKVPRGNELAGILRATEGVDVTTIDSSKIPSDVDAQTFFESQVNEAKTAGTPVAPGYYVISDRVLIVDEQGKVSPIL